MKTCQLILGFKFGFDLGHRGTTTNDLKVKNLTSASKNPKEIHKALNKELQAGRLAGPFKEPPFTHFQISPIGLVPKKNGKFRLIVHLSSPKADSINSHIDNIFSDVQYATLQDAFKLILGMGPHPYMAKLDIQSAFRLIPIKPEQYNLLCIKWEDQYYYDRCLPMGARSSCALFESFSSAIEHIAVKQGVTSVIHYLDDFFLVNRNKEGCQKDLSKITNICAALQVPLAAEKTKGPTQLLDFLGFEINTITETVSLPKEKVLKGIMLINKALESRKISLEKFQSILGFLNFASTVIFPGRAFLQNLYAKTSSVSKPYHKVTLNKQDKEDLQMWKQFLSHHNGIYLYKEELFLSPQMLHLYTDACGSLGMGAVLGTHWLYAQWPSQWYHDQNIVFLEFLPIIFAIKTWGTALKNKVVLLHLDNEALVYVINKQSSKETLVRMLLRNMVMCLLKFNIVLKATHIPGINNILADSLSRLQITRFQRLHLQADTTPAELPPLPQEMSSCTKLCF